MTIHYHGTPLTPLSAFYELRGRHFCVSHAAPQDVRRAHEIGQSVMLDNGAFSKWKSGRETDWPAFYDWAEPWLAFATTWAVIPDVIDGGSQMQDALIREWPFGQKGAPVWHMDEPVADEVRGVLDGHVVLDRAIAARGRYPAVDVTVSLSRVMDQVVAPEHKAAAAKLVQYLATPAASKFLAVEGSLLPTYQSVYTDVDVVKAVPWFKDAAQVVIAGRSRPVSKDYGQVSDVIRTTTSAVLARTKTPDEGVGEIEGRLRRVMR